MTHLRNQVTIKWIRATTLGWLLGIVVVLGLSVLNESIGLSEFQFFIGMGMGAGIGLMQWRVLKLSLGTSTTWIWYSVIGLGTPFLFFDLLEFSTGIKLGEHYIIYSLLLAGALAGYLQYTLLRAHSTKAVLWIPATFLGLVLAMLAFLGINYTNHLLSGNWPIFATNLFLILVGGLILGTITGLVLQYLLKSPNPDAK